MKTHLLFVIPFAVLNFIFSCDEENYDLEDDDVVGDHVTKITLDGISAQDSLTFHYNDNKITSVDWCTTLDPKSNDCLVGYSETRTYDELGKLDSVGGKWQLSYDYEGGLRKSIIAVNDDEYYSTTTFTDYSGGYPVNLRVEFADGIKRNIHLTFNTNGDLERKLITNADGVLLEEVRIEYSMIENPLKGMIETPAYAVLFFGFDDFAFYFSNHVPVKVITEFTNETPVYPKNFTVDYHLMVDNSGKLVSANASRTTNVQTYDLHKILITYNK